LPRLRLFLAVVAIGCALAGSAHTVGAVAAEHASCGRTVTSGGNGWLALHPHFPSGPQKVTIAQQVRYFPNRIFATNGSSVMDTEDGGCHWRALAIPTSPGQAILPVSLPQPFDGLLRIPSTLHITSLSAPSSATSSEYLYIGGTNSSLLRDQPVVYAVHNGVIGASSGMPDDGDLAEVTASDAVPTTAYAVVTGGGPLGKPGLYATTNGGNPWALRPASTGGVADLHANPVVNTSLFALSSKRLVVNNDGGQSSFSAARGPARDVTSYDVVSGGGGARLVEGHSSVPEIDRSDDGGVSWMSRPAPVSAKQVALLPLEDIVAITDGLRVFVQEHIGSGRATCRKGKCTAAPSESAHEITPRARNLTQLSFSAPSSAGYALVAVGGGSVLRRTFDSEGRGSQPGDSLVPISLEQHGPPHQFPSTLTPGVTNVSLRPGAHRDVPFRLLLPRTPSPVDLMFLVDTTDSMAPTINGLRRDLATIVNDVASTGLDTRFGVAEFRDYPPQIDDMGAGERWDYPYKLRRIIGPDDASLQVALNQLRHGGGGDPPEADLTALYQSTTGIGQRWGAHNQHVVIKPGLEAQYRPGSLRLAILATDAPFHRERHYLTPTWQTTVSALLSNNVFPIGIAVEKVDDNNKPAGFQALHDEDQLAEATHSLAPPGGVDCNGDLVPDIAAGGPFVCRAPLVITSTNVAGLPVGSQATQPVKLAPAIVTAAEMLPDLRGVGLALHGAPASVARVVVPAARPVVNLRNDNTLDYTVRFTCPSAHHAHVYQLGIGATDGLRTLATSHATVTCGAVPVKHSVVPPIAALAPVAAAAAPPAPANPVPNANPNPNPVPNANVGFAGQEEEQKQLAFADADTGLDETTELAMSRPSSDNSNVDPWLFGACAILLTAAAGYAARSRFQAAWHRG